MIYKAIPSLPCVTFGKGQLVTGVSQAEGLPVVIIYRLALPTKPRATVTQEMLEAATPMFGIRFESKESVTWFIKVLSNLRNNFGRAMKTIEQDVQKRSSGSEG